MSGILSRILVPIDESQTANRAIGVAIGLAVRHKAELIFCTAIDHAAATAECVTPYGWVDTSPMLAVLDENARTLLNDAERLARDAGVTASSRLLEGAPAGAIVACARARAADAIVMGTQGKHGLERVFLGSTAEGVLRGTEVPTFVVHPGDAAFTADFKRILVAIDGSEPAAEALAFALELAKFQDGRLLLCNVVESTVMRDNSYTPGSQRTPFVEQLQGGARALEAAVAQAKAAGIAADAIAVEGSPIEKILWAAKTQDADAIMIGTHGRRGLDRLLLGSIAEGVVRRSPIPVAVVREGTARVVAAEKLAEAASAR